MVLAVGFVPLNNCNVLAEQKVATVRTNPAFNLFTDFENFSTFKPGAHMAAGVNDMLDELLLWSKALPRFADLF